MGNGAIRAPPNYEDFCALAGEYDRLRAAGLSKEELHLVVCNRINASIASGGDASARNLLSPAKDNQLRREESVSSARGPSGPAAGGGAGGIGQASLNLHSIREQGEMESKEDPPLPPGAAGLVLLIDDSPVASKVASKVLTKLSFEVITANSAKMGFDILNARKEEITLVFLDVVMPNVDGVECLGWIKDSPDVAHIPVYMLSGLEDQTLSDVCIERGAEGMLLKPLNAEIVRKIMKDHGMGQQGMAVLAAGGERQERVSDLTLPMSALLSNEGPKSFSKTAKTELGSPTKRAKAGSTMVGSQAPAFKLMDSDFNEFLFPLPASRKNVLLLFLPTIHCSEWFDPENGFLTKFFKYYEYLVSSRKVLVVGITADLPHALQAAKRIHQIPFVLLSDPSLFVSQRYVGSIDFGRVLCKVEDVRNESHTAETLSHAQHSLVAPCLGVMLLNRKREVLRRWIAYLDEFEPDLKQFPPDFEDWLGQCVDISANTNPLSGPGAISEDDRTMEKAGNNGGIATLTQANLQALNSRSESSNNSIGLAGFTTPIKPALKPGHSYRESSMPLTVNPIPPGSNTGNGFGNTSISGKTQTSFPGNGGNAFVNYTSSAPALAPSPLASPATEWSSAVETKSRNCVMVVDDSSISSRIVCKKLEDMDFEVRAVYNGQLAYDMLKKSPKLFSIVLTDVVMPICDGPTLLKLIKADTALKHIPVIMLSGLESQELIQSCLDGGAKAVMRKPFEPQVFRDIIKDLL
eukprot:gene1962-2140_t